MGFYSRERDGHNSRYSMGKGEFIAKGQSGDLWMDSYEEEAARVRENLAKPT